jgi:uncharacterized membrane protein YeaQ/YmgE (transglycosylase-associated protein family)
MEGIIAWIVIGAVAGWLAGLLVKGGGFGLVVDIIVGVFSFSSFVSSNADRQSVTT